MQIKTWIRSALLANSIDYIKNILSWRVIYGAPWQIFISPAENLMMPQKYRFIRITPPGFLAAKFIKIRQAEN